MPLEDDLYTEVLTRAALDGKPIHLQRLDARELRLVLANRLCWARLMMRMGMPLHGARPGELIKPAPHHK